MPQSCLPIRRTFLAYCLAALLLGACGQAATAQSVPSTPTPLAQTLAPVSTATITGTPVTIDNFTFTPGTLTVAIGTTVTWINHDDLPHTVTAQDHKFSSAGLDTDDQFSHQFTLAGSYVYYCTIHPKMTATIIVR